MFISTIAVIAMAQLTSAQFLSPMLFDFPAFPSLHRHSSMQPMNPLGLKPTQRRSFLAEQMLEMQQMLNYHKRGRLYSELDALANLERTMLDSQHSLSFLPVSAWGLTNRPNVKKYALQPPMFPDSRRERQPGRARRRTGPDLQHLPASHITPPDEAQAKINIPKKEFQPPLSHEASQQQHGQPATDAQPLLSAVEAEQKVPAQEQSSPQNSVSTKAQRRAKKQEFYRQQKISVDQAERERVQKERAKRETMERELDELIQMVDTPDVSTSGGEFKISKHDSHLNELGEEILKL